MKNVILESYLLVSRNDEFSHRAIKDFLNNDVIINIKKIISLTGNLDESIIDFILRKPEVELIFQKRRFKSLFEHMQILSQKSNSDFITFLHDDDLISKKYLIENYKIITKFYPDALSSSFTYIDVNNKKCKNRNRKSKKIVKRINGLISLTSFFLPFQQVIMFPTLIYKTSKLQEYWRKNVKSKNYISKSCKSGLCNN